MYARDHMCVHFYTRALCVRTYICPCWPPDWPYCRQDSVCACVTHVYPIRVRVCVRVRVRVHYARGFFAPNYFIERAKNLEGGFPRVGAH